MKYVYLRIKDERLPLKIKIKAAKEKKSVIEFVEEAIKDRLKK